MRRTGLGFVALLISTFALVGCGRQAIVEADGLPLQRVVVYRNGVAYFERGGHVEEDQVRFKMKETEVGDFLATLAVMERGGSSVRSAAFPLKDEESDAEETAKVGEESETALDEALQRVTDRDLLWYDWSEIKNVPRA